jgi:hypothetical protein
MKPTPKQVDEISEVIALLLEDINEDSCEQFFEAQEGFPVSEAALAHALARSLASKDGEPVLRGLLEGAHALLRVSLEAV